MSEVDAALPRTLVVSEAPIGSGNGFGVTLAAFFHDWPAEHLRVLYTRPDTGGATGANTFADVPGHWGRRFGVACLLGQRPAWRGRYSARWLRAALRGWTPDVVYAFVFSRDTLAFASWVAARLRRPLIAHVADDGLETPQAGVPQDAGALLRGAAHRIVISDEMRTEYRARYGVDSDVLHNGAADDLLAGEPAAAVAAAPFTVRYLGSVVPVIHFGAIEDIGTAVRRLEAAAMPARFELCGGEWTRAHAEGLSGGPVVYRGAVSHDEGVALLQTADLLVIPVSFETTAFTQRRLSLPTKLTEYLASGTPTLVYGPRGVAPVEFCRRHGVGTILDERSPERLESLMRALASAPADARRRARLDREFVRRQYSAAAARARFRAILSGVAARRARVA